MVGLMPNAAVTRPLDGPELKLRIINMRRRHDRCKSLPQNASSVAATATPRRFVARGGGVQLIGVSLSGDQGDAALP